MKESFLKGAGVYEMGPHVTGEVSLFLPGEIPEIDPYGSAERAVA